MTTPESPDPSAQPSPAEGAPYLPPPGQMPTPYGQQAYGAPQYGAPQYGGSQQFGAPSGYLPEQNGGRPAMPGAVKTVSILMYVGATFAVIGAIGLLFVTAAVGRNGGVGGHAVSAFAAVLGVVLIAIAAAYVILAIFLRKGSRVARIITVVLTGLSMLANLSHFRGGSIFSVFIGALIIYLLMFNPDSKRYFGDRVG